MKDKKKIKKMMGRAALVLLVIAGLLLGLRVVAQHRIYQEAVSANAVSRLETMNLGGEEQSVLIEGRDADLPVLIMLHGGPQSPIIYGTGYRGDTPELSRNFIVVYWDLWGCGKNFAPDPERVTLEDQVTMTCDLVRAVKAEYPDRPVYLFGYSNGTILSIEAAKTIGDELAGVISLGPITSMRDARELAYQSLLTADLSAGERKKLEENYPKDDADSMAVLEELVTFKTSRMVYWRELLNNTRLLAYFTRVFYSPDYSLMDIYRAYYASIYGGGAYKNLKRQIYEVDEKEAMRTLDVPLLVLQAEDDIYAPADFFRQLARERDNVTYVSIPECAHLPTNTGFDAVNQAIIDFAK
ncbi:alpha/beta hydrolase [Eubacterium sp. 1001713B170207_170306_E7]|uniref:alpha/beta fold hydrolase n=1 Tax=Eubacterium sp. 1001713B170207_170306_E7 TaxID=2787097 RepID=UPI0018994658|nr:alpha/beta hydrolase [Eubacterium sp. 1001713B170207_170306_E7]